MICGWLSPQGELVYCKPWEHYSKARTIIGNASLTPDEDLYEKGWIKIGFDGYKMHIDAAKDIATEQQKLYLEKLYGRYGKGSFCTNALRNLYYVGVVDELEPW